MWREGAGEEEEFPPVRQASVSPFVDGEKASRRSPPSTNVLLLSSKPYKPLISMLLMLLTVEDLNPAPTCT